MSGLVTFALVALILVGVGAIVRRRRSSKQEAVYDNYTFWGDDE